MTDHICPMCIYEGVNINRDGDYWAARPLGNGAEQFIVVNPFGHAAIESRNGHGNSTLYTRVFRSQARAEKYAKKLNIRALLQNRLLDWHDSGGDLNA